MPNSVKSNLSSIYGEGDIFEYSDGLNKDFYLVCRTRKEGDLNARWNLISLSSGTEYSGNKSDIFNGVRDKYFRKCYRGEKITIQVDK